MKSVLKETRERMQKSIEAFDSNVATVRTGRANPAVLNRIVVDYYGTSTPLNQLASTAAALLTDRRSGLRSDDRPAARAHSPL